MRQGEEVTVPTSDRTGRSTDVAVMLRVNGSVRQLQLDSRVTLLDALREHLDLVGTKKGCDQGGLRRMHGFGRRQARAVVPVPRRAVRGPGRDDDRRIGAGRGAAFAAGGVHPA